MNYTDIVKNVKIYGLTESFIASGYPMKSTIGKMKEIGVPDVKRATKLGKCESTEGHDNFELGIVVQFDLTFTNKAWVEAERYHFLDIISSQSTMHRITKFDLDNSYNKFVDPRIVEIMKEKVDRYNNQELSSEEKKNLYLEILYSNPSGFKITARMTTNYRQLKNIYKQRKNHRLPEWKCFCEWIETLPYHEELITGGIHDV
jgi:hypothetical protein